MRYNAFDICVVLCSETHPPFDDASQTVMRHARPGALTDFVSRTCASMSVPSTGWKGPTY